ncbi:restriction endonuclease [Blastococcus brunescens]|uniref:Restriction endonuclease n=1 Tax=Blastococcus brunescens TaxID=1564165 RepID=A0ABZ1AXN7_9ACTN|nr:restriction endonuclease [Blastococcus sp. BMG 8361]WRL62266.1 restriction endonuclease [Blastococcus sp. BMG 8361]
MPLPPEVHIKTWQQAEENAAAWMRWWGFADARVTPTGADGGIDVLATTAIAQVKFKAAQVGRPDVQRLAGARGSANNRAILFFTGIGFTKPAVEYADRERIALFEYAMSGEMTPVSSAARILLRNVEEREAAVVRAREEAAAAETRAAEEQRATAQRAAERRAAVEREAVARRAGVADAARTRQASEPEPPTERVAATGRDSAGRRRPEEGAQRSWESD